MDLPSPKSRGKDHWKGWTSSQDIWYHNIRTESKVAETDFEVKVDEVFSIEISIQNYGVIRYGAQGAGHGAWLFLDEIVVE